MEVEDTILCLTETQKKVDDVRIENIIIKQSMRDMQDRRVGGLLCVYCENNFMLKQNQMVSKVGDVDLIMVLV